MPDDKPAPKKAPDHHEDYWRANLKILTILLIIWFTVPIFLGIVFVEQLNQFKLGGFPLGFWIAQQGSIWVFLGLIVVYAFYMRHLDRKFNVQEEENE